MAKAPTLERMPTELILQILHASPSVSSLASIIQTSSLFYRIFKASEQSITNTVFENEVDLTEVLPEALAMIDVVTTKDIDQFIEVHIHSRTSRPCLWTLREALYLSGFHGHVQFFALKYGEKVFAELKNGEDTIPYHPAEPEELHRIQRALYRFETCCLLLGTPWTPNTLWLIRFFSNLSVWEMAQINSVQGYLCVLIQPVFNGIAEEDITWGASEIGVIDADADHDPYLQHLISLGLAHIRQIIEATSYEDQYRLLGHIPEKQYYFLQHACWKLAFRVDPQYMGEYICDNHQEPDEIYAWFDQVGRTLSSNPSDLYDLSARGLCFWSTPRLRLWQQTPSIEPWDPTEEEESRATEMRSWRAQIELAFERKVRIHRLGGRGRMRDINESKLIQSNKYKYRQEPRVPSLMSIYRDREALDQCKRDKAAKESRDI